jgi:hypothetical protein
VTGIANEVSGHLARQCGGVPGMPSRDRQKGAGNGIIDGRGHLKYIHLAESDRGTCD